jgi:hypothetical protein
MDALFILFAIVTGLIGLDIAAFGSGTDSRDGIGDDHAR